MHTGKDCLFLLTDCQNKLIMLQIQLLVCFVQLVESG
uniref:Uncharacterized protein n=1 Tax=Rhizophora mucronata TaxID=61149 RepID=A0A2P2NWL1_RHIMU